MGLGVRQEGHEDEERHLRQLMDLMQHEDSCSDEETEGHARLMALAAQVATQRGPSQPISQAVRPCHPETSVLTGDVTPARSRLRRQLRMPEL